MTRFTIREVAERFRRSEEHVLRLINSGELRTINVGTGAVCSGETIAGVKKLAVQFYGEQVKVTILRFGQHPETSFRGGLNTSFR